MFVVLVGDFNNGFSVHGPFHSGEEAISWGVNEADGGAWFEMEVHHPDDYNAETPDADEHPTEVSMEELERYLAGVEASRKQNLPKEVMIDLSELPVEA